MASYTPFASSGTCDPKRSLRSVMKTTHHIVFAGGGTAGHLFPGLAVAEKLAANRPGVRITFAGTGKPLERELVAAAGFDYLALSQPAAAAEGERRALVRRGEHGRILCRRTVSGRRGRGRRRGTGRIRQRAAGPRRHAPPPAAGAPGAERRAGQGQSLAFAAAHVCCAQASRRPSDWAVRDARYAARAIRRGTLEDGPPGPSNKRWTDSEVHPTITAPPVA